MKDIGFIWTGDRPYFIVGKDKTRVPDYVNIKTKEVIEVNIKTKEVIEVFGYWYHRDKSLPEGKKHETPEEYIKWYSQLGWSCKIFWEDEFEEFCRKLGN